MSRNHVHKVDLNKLRSLPLGHQQAFAASCCERLLPNYHAFHEIEQWGQPEILVHSLDSLWRLSQGEQLTPGQLQQLISACEIQAPDTDDFTSLFSMLAVDAVQAVIAALSANLGEETSSLQIVSETAINSVDHFLGAVGEPYPGGFSDISEAFDAWIFNSPLLQAEIRQQNEDIVVLISQQALSAGFVERFRRSSTKTGIQPYLRGILVKK